MSVSDFSGQHFCVIDDFIRLFFLHDHREVYALDNELLEEWISFDLDL